MVRVAAERTEKLVRNGTLSNIDLAIGAEDEHSRIAELVRDELQEEKRGRVGPVQIVEHQDERRPLGGGPEERRDRIEEVEPRVLRVR